MSNARRHEPDPAARLLPGRFVVTPAFRDLTVVGIGDHDGISTMIAALARAMAWSGVAPLAVARETCEADTGRERVELRSDIRAPDAVQETWRAFKEGRRVGEEMIMATTDRPFDSNNSSRAFSGSEDRIPDGRPIRGTGIAEIFVRFRDWQIYYQPCKTGMVATARIASWLSRYPLAHVRETSTQLLIIVIDIDENCPEEFKTMERA